jgi:tetratricopeptide (TPR) repeat protein
LIGTRIDADPDAAIELAERCARLPLALRVAAEYAADRPRLDIHELIDSLAAERSLLDAFDDETDERADVRAVFSWSYRHLPAPAARLFRLLAAHPVGPVDESAMAALVGDDTQARSSLRALASGHLIQLTGGHRWQMHDLLRAYSLDRFADETDAERSATRVRLLDFYIAATAAAMDLAFPAERATRGDIPSSPHAATPPVDPEAALRWLDANRGTLVDCVDLAARHGHAEQVALLSRLLWRYLDAGAHYAAALTVHRHALDLARARGNVVEEGQVRTRIGVVYLRWGRNAEALNELTEALAANHRAGNETAAAGSHNALGLLHTSLGQYGPAIEHLTLALDAARQTGSPVGEITTLDNIGRTHRLWGRLTLAARLAHEALAACRRANTADPGSFAIFEGKLLANLAATELLQGRIEDAGEHAHAALEVCDAGGDVIGAAMARETIAWWQLRSGRPEAALSEFGALIDLQAELGDADGRTSTRNGIGAAHLQVRRFDEAADQFERALRRGRDEGDVGAQCESLNGLGWVAVGAGDVETALARFADAFALSATIDEWYERAGAAHGMAEAHRTRGDMQAASTWDAEALIWYERSGAAAQPQHHH